MTKILTLLLAAVALLWVGDVAAAERGTPDEAKAMLAKALAHYKAVGRKQALADFSGRKAPFFDRDLYVVCLGADHTIVAHGGFPAFVGSPVDSMRDAEGKPLGKALWDAASGPADGATRYRVLNAATGKVEPKVSFVRKAGDDVCLVGAFSP